MKRRKRKRTPNSCIARNRTAKNECTCPLSFHLLIYKGSTGAEKIHYYIVIEIYYSLSKTLSKQNMRLPIDKMLHYVVFWRRREML